MRVWLDDVRVAPSGWTWVKTSADAIALLAGGAVAEISLDHDLGDDDAFGTGYSVVCWIEDGRRDARLRAAADAHPFCQRRWARQDGAGHRQHRAAAARESVAMTDPRFYLVIDLEATTSDDGSLPPEQMETIEIGAVLVDARTLEPEGEFQSFVRPVRHPQLLPFCTTLTDITQAMVDDAPLFPEAFAALRAKLIDHRHPLLFCSWGRYDRIQLERDCGLRGIPNNMPAHVNVKTRFTDVQGIKKKLGMAQALKHCGLPLEGAHHRGIDDARNIARLLPWIVGTKALHLVDPTAERGGDRS